MRISIDKTCKKCGADSWYVRANGHRNCAPCKQKTQKTWDEKNRDKRLAYVYKYQEKHNDYSKVTRSQHLKRKYNITLEEYDVMFEQQGKVCALCNQVNQSKYWHLDHDHLTGKVRGILCHHCNLILGNARDNIETLKLAIGYLERHA